MCQLDADRMAEKQLTILQMLPALESGGVERGTLEIADALVQGGHRSLVMSAGGRLVEELEAQGSKHIQWAIDRKSLWTLRFVWALRKFIIKERVDVIHYRSRVPGWVAYLAWKGMDASTRPRLVSTMHGLHSVSRYSAVMAKGERVIAVSDTVREYIKSNYLTENDSAIVTIYRGVDEVEFPRDFQPSALWLERWQDAHPELNDHFLIALPGRMTRLKGHLDFIDVICTLRERGVSAIGLVVGGEDKRRKSYANEVYESVSRKGADRAVLFLGHRTDMREIYSQCDAVLSLSNKPESFGRTVLEALTMGKPVVGYAHGGVGEVLSQLYPSGGTALGDTVAVVDKLESIAAGNFSQVEQSDEFTKCQMQSKTIRLYENLVGQS